MSASQADAPSQDDKPTEGPGGADLTAANPEASSENPAPDKGAGSPSAKSAPAPSANRAPVSERDAREMAEITAALQQADAGEFASDAQAQMVARKWGRHAG